MRTLICFHIVHSAGDFGSLAEFIMDEYGKTYGREKWQEHLKAIDEKWRQIRQKVMSLDLEWHTVKIYQDGLPVCGKEREIVCELAEAGNVNHKIVCELLQKGATIEGTEDPLLLRQEYGYILKIGQSKSLEERDRMIEACNKAGGDLILKRDKFIAHRIDQTLEEGESGVLFLGAMHRVDMYIPTDIAVKHLS